MTIPDHGPGVRLPPPVLVGGVLAVAWFAHLFFRSCLARPCRITARWCCSWGLA
jgi:hypothetical protein